MVITTEEHFRLRVPYIKESVLLILLFLSYFSIYFSGMLLVFEKNILNLILFLLALVVFSSIQTIVILTFPFLYNLGIIILQALVLGGVIGFYWKNLNLASLISVIFFIFYLIYWWRLTRIYQDTLKFNFFTFFKISWDFLSYALLVFLFLMFVYFFNFGQLSKGTIQNFIGKLSYFFEIINLGITPETKIKDILARNLPKDIDEKTKTEALKMGIEELNKRLNIKMSLETTIKEALAEYFYVNFQKINENQNSLLAYKIILGIFLILVVRYFLLLIGLIGSFLGYLIFAIFKSVKLISIDHQLLEKEFIKI